MFRLREALPNTPNGESFPGVAVSRCTRVRLSRPTLNAARHAFVSHQDLPRTAGVSPKESNDHEARRLNPVRVLVARSRTSTIFSNDNSLAEPSRIKPVASALADFQFAEGSRPRTENRRAGVDPKRLRRGAIGASQGARASDFGRVVRLTGGFANNRSREVRGVVIGRDGRPIRAPEAIFFEMLTCERCGASFPACGWCPFCNPRGIRQ